MTTEEFDTNWEIVARALGTLASDSVRFDTRYDEIMASLKGQVRDVYQGLLSEEGDHDLRHASPVARLPEETGDRWARTRERVAQALTVFIAECGEDLEKGFEEVAGLLRPAARSYHGEFWRREVNPPPRSKGPERTERVPDMRTKQDAICDCSFQNLREIFGLLGYPPRFTDFLLKYRFLADIDSPVNEHQRGCPYVYPGLREGPLLDDLVRPAIDLLEGAFSDIREELLLCMERGGFEKLDPNWQGFPFFSFKTGEAIRENQAMFPRTMATIRQVPGLNSKARNFVCLRRLPQGVKLHPHWGTTNIRVRIHLGLSGCEGARMRIGDSVYSWEEGKCFALDDSFRHEAWNDGPQDRFALVVDVHHPDLTTLELKALSKLPFASLFVRPGSSGVFVRTPLASEDSLSSVAGMRLLNSDDVVPG